MTRTTFRLALANLPFPTSGDEALAMALKAIREAGEGKADVVCFPESFIPGYRAAGRDVEPPSESFLLDAWEKVSAAARAAAVVVVLGTERIEQGRLFISALVVDASGAKLGFQDKVQLDPSEEEIYSPGSSRAVFNAGGLVFGIAICHEAWRYPETVRWAARHGARVVFHPHFHEATPGSYRPTTFAEPGNTFHEKAMLCRAAENTCYFASVNCASTGSPTTSAVVGPDGGLVAFQPYGQPGLLVVNVDIRTATNLLAYRLRLTSDAGSAAEPAGGGV